VVVNVSDFSSEDSSFSDIGKAVIGTLRTKHGVYENSVWRSSSAQSVGCVQSPPGPYFVSNKLNHDVENTHSDFLPEKICDMISSAEKYVDIATLSAPDGKFRLNFMKAMMALHKKNKVITVRLLIGNVVGQRTNGYESFEKLTKEPDYPILQDTKLRLHFGCYNVGISSWNHSKIIAVDGKHLLQGGHNWWEADYLSRDPIRDISMEAHGAVAYDGHMYCNRLWEFLLRSERNTALKRKMPDFIPIVTEAAAEVASWPLDDPPDPYAGEAPGTQASDVKIISLGRLAKIHGEEEPPVDRGCHNPSDSAILALIAVAQRSLRFSLQDVGPLAINVPGLGLWSPYPFPEEFLSTLGHVMYERGVDVEIVLSGPGSRGYGYGWTCDDVAAELVRLLQKKPHVSHDRIRAMVDSNLRLCYMRTSGGDSDWGDGPCGNHAKFFIVDDAAYYMGSQNMYVSDLAEWGLVVDDKRETEKILEEYWRPVWKASYVQNRDCTLDEVFEKVGLSRPSPAFDDLPAASREEWFLQEGRACVKCTRPTKKLHVWVKRAAGATEEERKMYGITADPEVYLKVRLVDSKGSCKGSFRSRGKHRCAHIHNMDCNELFTFTDLYEPDSMSLVINFYDHKTFCELDAALVRVWTDHLVVDEKLGQAKISLHDLQQSGDVQEREVVMGNGPYAHTTVVLGLNTENEWGNIPV